MTRIAACRHHGERAVALPDGSAISCPHLIVGQNFHFRFAVRTQFAPNCLSFYLWRIRCWPNPVGVGIPVAWYPRTDPHVCSLALKAGWRRVFARRAATRLRPGSRGSVRLERSRSATGPTFPFSNLERPITYVWLPLNAIARASSRCRAPQRSHKALVLPLRRVGVIVLANVIGMLNTIALAQRSLDILSN